MCTKEFSFSEEDLDAFDIAQFFNLASVTLTIKTESTCKQNLT